MIAQLSQRANGAVRWHGGVEKLSTLTDSQIARTPNVGRKTFNELMCYLGRTPAPEVVCRLKPQAPKDLKPAGATIYLTVTEMNELRTSNREVAAKILAAMERALRDYETRSKYRG